MNNLGQKNISTFHKENKYTIYQSKVCFEAWHLEASPKALKVYWRSGAHKVNNPIILRPTL